MEFVLNNIVQQQKLSSVITLTFLMAGKFSIKDPKLLKILVEPSIEPTLFSGTVPSVSSSSLTLPKEARES